MTKIAASSTASTSPDEAHPAPSAAKPSKRVAKKTTSMTKQVKTVWTSEMVATLLEKRCDDYAASFELNRSAAQLSILWGKIALSINTVHGTNVPALVVKNKYCSLKREYSAIRMAEKSTGNEVTVTYPEYWDELVSALGGMHGLGHHDYAFDNDRSVQKRLTLAKDYDLGDVRKAPETLRTSFDLDIFANQHLSTQTTLQMTSLRFFEVVWSVVWENALEMILIG
ncbi:hypothetical protein AC1031_014350 [Aphanomyces cochlioides]|nr:hypothetical protein AC1031_014350 [Aphanomyces cochlioides]